jgi:hypothetical protein
MSFRGKYKGSVFANYAERGFIWLLLKVKIAKQLKK